MFVYICFSIIGCIIGLFMIIGTILKFKSLVDPAENSSNSHSLIKRYFGSGFLVIYNYIVGALFLLISLIIFFQAINGNIR